MKKFRIANKYITSVKEEKLVVLYSLDGERIEGTSIGHIDHPKFTELRDKLEAQGYIETERSFINGDRVLKPFFVNGKKFNFGEKFPSSSYMSVVLSVHNESKKKKSKGKK
jgi:hypothetical protein